jgi:hypothetical protein
MSFDRNSSFPQFAAVGQKNTLILLGTASSRVSRWRLPSGRPMGGKVIDREDSGYHRYCFRAFTFGQSHNTFQMVTIGLIRRAFTVHARTFQIREVLELVPWVLILGSFHEAVYRPEQPPLSKGDFSLI